MEISDIERDDLIVGRFLKHLKYKLKQISPNSDPEKDFIYKMTAYAFEAFLDYVEWYSKDMEDKLCPICGIENPKRNSSWEIQCENCGFDEANE